MKYIIIIISLFCLEKSFAQTINWSSIEEEQNHIVLLNLGYDYGLTTQMGYVYKVNCEKHLLLSVDCSSPMGEDLLDDFKFRLGAQIPLLACNNFKLAFNTKGVLRRHETTLVRMKSFGYENTLLAGFYKAKGHLVVELGHDHAGRTHLNHSKQFKELYPEVKDGWYSKTGGHFFYGIQGSKKLGSHIDLSMRLGVTNARFSDKDDLIPFYFTIGGVYRI